MLRVVREVGIHLEHEVVAALERPPKPRHVRCSQAHLPRAAQDVHPRTGRDHPVHNLRGAVRRSVVDNEHFEPRILFQHILDETRDVLAFVVCRDDDQGALRREPALASVRKSRAVTHPFLTSTGWLRESPTTRAKSPSLVVFELASVPSEPRVLPGVAGVYDALAAIGTWRRPKTGHWTQLTHALSRSPRDTNNPAARSSTATARATNVVIIPLR